MKTNKNVTEEFVRAITKETSKLIAAHEHLTVKDAKAEFKKSKVYDYLCQPPVPFYEEDPEYFYEMYENLKHNGEMLDDMDLFLKQNHKLYTTSI